MNQRGKGITAKLLMLVMLAVFLCGSTVMAQESGSNDWLYAGNIKTGDYIRGISAGGPEGRYIDYDFFVNGVEYQCKEGNVFLHRYFEVTGKTIDDTNKTVNISGDSVIKFYASDKSDSFSWKKVGETVTVDLAKEYKAELDNNKDKEFKKWYVWAWRSNNSDEGYQKKYSLEEAASVLGVKQEALQEKECTVTFKIPAEWGEFMVVGIDPAFEGSDSTISGNIPSEPEKNESGSSNSGRTTAPEPVVKKEVVLSDGSVLKSNGSIHNIASGINGAAVMTSQEEMNTRAGLSAQDVEAGVNARLYMGNTYKKAEKTMLTDAVSQTGAKVIAFINIDLYTIAKNGKVESISKPNGEEAIRVVIGLPAGVAKEGRSFSLVYMDENGKAVEIPDMDSDLRTLTVDLTRFGAFAIVYR